MTIQEIQALGDNVQIPSFTGRIVAYYDKKGPGAHGEFKQDVKVHDSTGEGWLVLAGKGNQFEPGISHVGKDITVTCSTAKSGGLVGVKVKKNTYQGRNDNRIWVTDAAKIALSSASSQAPAPSNSQPPSQTKDANRRMIVIDDSLAKAHAEAWVHMYELTRPIFSKVLSEEQIPERVTSLMISAARGEFFASYGDADNDWRNLVISKKSGTKLGDLPLDKLCQTVTLLLTKQKGYDEAVGAIDHLISIGSLEDVMIKCVTLAYPGHNYNLEAFANYIKENNLKTAKDIAGALSDPDIYTKMLNSNDDEIDIAFDIV